MKYWFLNFVFFFFSFLSLIFHTWMDLIITRTADRLCTGALAAVSSFTHRQEMQNIIAFGTGQAGDFSIWKKKYFFLSVVGKIQIADLIIKRCGDMVVDPEEECDCGLPNYCRNQCCDPHTCRFSLRNPKVQCADGACCDLMVYLKSFTWKTQNYY